MQRCVRRNSDPLQSLSVGKLGHHLERGQAMMEACCICPVYVGEGAVLLILIPPLY